MRHPARSAHLGDRNGGLDSKEAFGDFALTAHVRVRPVHQYDQAGVMVRVSSSCWLKASVELALEQPDIGAEFRSYLATVDLR